MKEESKEKIKKFNRNMLLPMVSLAVGIVIGYFIKGSKKKVERKNNFYKHDKYYGK